MTAQAGDLIYYNGERLQLFATPLESFWDDCHPRPQFADSLTAIARGYVATWAISDEMLYLENVWGEVVVDAKGKPIPCSAFMQQRTSGGISGKQFSVPATVELLFPESKGRVAATWFTGRLYIPRGTLLRQGYMGFDSVYEEEIMLELENGSVVRTQVTDNRDNP